MAVVVKISGKYYRIEDDVLKGTVEAHCVNYERWKEGVEESQRRNGEKVMAGGWVVGCVSALFKSVWPYTGFLVAGVCCVTAGMAYAYAPASETGWCQSEREGGRLKQQLVRAIEAQLSQCKVLKHSYDVPVALQLQWTKV